MRTLKNVGNRARGLMILATTAAMTGLASAQTGSGNVGADAVITKVEGLVPVATAVIAAAVLVIVVPWGAKMAVRAFKSIGGA